MIEAIIGATLGFGTSALGSIFDAGRTVDAVRREGRALMLSISQGEHHLKELERVAGDKLSQSQLQMLKLQSRIKAASAESGGTLSQDVIASVAVEKLHQDSAIIREHEARSVNQGHKMIREILQFEHRTDALIDKIDPFSAVLGAVSGGVKGFMGGMDMMPMSSQMSMFGVDMGSTPKFDSSSTTWYK